MGLYNIVDIIRVFYFERKTYKLRNLFIHPNRAHPLICQLLGEIRWVTYISICIGGWPFQ